MRYDNLTSREADAWRLGWTAALAHADEALTAQAEAHRRAGQHPQALAIDNAARAVARTRMPEPMRAATGLDYRGG